ncbi:MAG: Fic family protein [Fimbriimonadales bacterium]
MQSESRRFLTLEEVLMLHEIAIERYGGSAGVRDIGLVESAISLPMQTWDGEYLVGGVPEMAAAYWHGLSKNHGFIDGNKRVGFMATDAFLQLNGLLLTLTEAEAEDVALRVATSDCSREELAEIIRANCKPLD